MFGPNTYTSKKSAIHKYKLFHRIYKGGKYVKDIRKTYKYGAGKFRCRVYNVDAEGKNKIAKYIQNRLEEDNDAEQISKKEYKELFADNKSKQAKKRQPHVSGCQR